MTGKLDTLKANAHGALATIAEAVSALEVTGVIEILKSVAQPIYHPPGTENFLEVKAGQYDFLRGYHTALYNLLNFKEVFFTDLAGPDAPLFDFGGVDSLEASGALTKEEADAIRRGETPPELKRIDGRTLNRSSAKA